MGKRSTQNTKSGRAMNPADQARKEARRRELKKNKKQRLVVREAVIKAKDPKKVIEELQRMDQMEYNTSEAPPLPDHVLLERRRRLLGNFNRCLSLYEKDDKTMYAELKKMLAAYHKKHDELRRYYDSVKRAQSVAVDDIPMPMAPAEDDAVAQVEEVKLPSLQSQGPSLVSASRLQSWEAFSDSLQDTGGKRPPGPPCCPPPTLSDDSDDEIETKEEIEVGDEVESDEDVEDDMDQGKPNEVSERPEDDASTDEAVEPIPEAITDTPVTLAPLTDGVVAAQPPRLIRPSAPHVGRPPFVPPGPNFRNVPPPSLHRFPPVRPGHPGMHRLMRPPPPGYPTGLGPIGPVIPGMRPEFDPMGFRPPIPGLPVPGASELQAVVEAKPKLRNMMAEVTRLIPTSVKIKREEVAKPKPKPIAMGPNTELIPHRPVAQQQAKGGADQAYAEFLKEMEGFL